jgi:hypothetical protein
MIRRRGHVREGVALLAAACLAAAFAAGCLDLNRYYRYVSTGERMPTGTRALVEPTMASADFPRRFDDGIAALHEMIRERLQGAGFRVLTEDESSALEAF